MNPHSLTRALALALRLFRRRRRFLSAALTRSAFRWILLLPLLRSSLHSSLPQVLAAQGLCIALHGLDSVGPPIIYGLDGAAHIRVQFRLILFRPFASEVIMGKIKACDATGILVSVDFFDHIFLPAGELQYPSHFDKSEGLWVWRYQGHDLFMDLEESIRVRITGVKFEVQKGGPSLTEEELAVMAPGSAAGTLAPSVVEAAAAKKIVKKPTIANFEPPMKVMASIKDDGLGLLSWWD